MKFSRSMEDGSQAETDMFAEVPACFSAATQKDIARQFSGLFSRYNKTLAKKEYLSFFSFSVFEIQVFLGLCCKLYNLLEINGGKKKGTTTESSVSRREQKDA